MATTFKHELALRKIFSAMYEGWMSAEDRAEFDTRMLALYGAKLDESLEFGLARGYSIEQQVKLALLSIAYVFSDNDALDDDLPDVASIPASPTRH